MMVGAPLTDPAAGNGALLASAEWTRALLTGTPAAIIATIAIATIGFLMLAGRVPLRRAALAVLGCFVVFGAGTITAGLLHLTDLQATSEQASASLDAEIVGPPPSSTLTPDQPEVYDPYAGASVPVR